MIGKTNIEELFIKEIASKGAGYSRIFGGDMNIMDWDNTSTIRKRRWEEALANTERATPGQYTYILISRILCEFRRTSRNRRYAPAGHLLRGVWPSIMYNDHAL